MKHASKWAYCSAWRPDKIARRRPCEPPRETNAAARKFMFSRRLLLAQRTRVVDLDGPLLLARDRPDGLRYEGSLVHPPTPALWG
jgi:hypothetical protein